MKGFNRVITLAALAMIALAGCDAGASGPQATLDRYFYSAERQDYATTYDCYYKRYKEKVRRDEYIKHRKEASVLQDYRIASLSSNGDTARAAVMLTFAPSEKLHRPKPVTVKVTEDLVHENGDWKIKVW